MAVSLTESAKQHDGKIIVIKGRQKCDIFGRWQFSIVELCGQQKILQAGVKILKATVMNVIRIQSAKLKAQNNGHIPDNWAARSEDSLQWE
jgi:hypothetical protein